MVSPKHQNEANELEDSEPMPPRELLEEVIFAIISHPEEMKVIEITDAADPTKVILQVHVGAADRGKVIGKGGVIAQNLRSLFGLIGQRTNTNIEVRIDGGPDHKPRPRPTNGRDSNGYDPNHNQSYYSPNMQMMLVPVPPGFSHDNRFNGAGNNRRNQNYRRPPRGS